MKINQEQKLLIVKQHVHEGVSLKALSKEYKYDIARLKYTVALYKKHGEDIFLKRGRAISYSRETKLEAIHRVKNGETRYSIGIEFGLTDPTVVGDWIKKYDKEGVQSITTTLQRPAYKTKREKTENQKIKELNERIKYLEGENEYLKKLSTLIQKKKVRK